MPRTRVPRPHNGGQWTRARFNAFIKSALRTASMRWPPRNDVLKRSRVERGKYRCAGYQVRPHIVTKSLAGKNNVFVDHIDPIVNPEVGFISWDELIADMFCEADNLQILCGDCHDRKTRDERERARLRRHR